MSRNWENSNGMLQSPPKYFISIELNKSFTVIIHSWHPNQQNFVDHQIVFLTKYQLSVFLCLLFAEKTNFLLVSQQNFSYGWWQILPQHQSTYLRGPESTSIEIPTFRPHLIKFSKTVSYELNLTSQQSHLEVLLLSKFGCEMEDFNWCIFWTSKVCTLMLRKYLSPALAILWVEQWLAKVLTWPL
jgi:hypothetical protein